MRIYFISHYFNVKLNYSSSKGEFQFIKTTICKTSSLLAI
jgi:hypothetical protein